MSRLISRTHDERGSVLAITALTIPVLLLFAALTLDVGNWFVHKRALQNRVDAAVRAAGLEFATAFPSCTTSAATESTVTDAVTKFAGVTSSLNRGVVDQNRLTVTVNGAQVFGSGPGATPHPCQPNAPDSISPQGGYWVDVTAAANDVPSFFGSIGLSPTISTGARVQLMGLDTVTGQRPFALTDPATANCTVVDFNGPNSITLTQDPNDPARWTGQLTNGSMPNNSNTNLTVEIECGAETYQGGIVSTLETNGAPRFTDVFLTPVSPCTNAYYIPHDGAACQVNVTAVVQGAGQNASFQASVGNSSFTMTRNAPNGNTWTTPNPITISPQGGGNDGIVTITLNVQNTGPGGGSDEVEHEVMTGDEDQQGPIQNVVLGDYARNEGSSFASNPLSIEVYRRSLTPGTTSVITRGIDCESGNLQSMFVNGCGLDYEVNSRGGDCTPPLTPRDCVGSLGGGSLASLTDEYDERWGEGATCTANNWTPAQNQIPPGDPRVITVFLTSSTNLGGGTHPITGFTALYITGWDAQGPGPSSCPGNQPWPRPGAIPNGAVWGRVLQSYVLTSDQGTPSASPCTASDTLCLASQVR